MSKANKKKHKKAPEFYISCVTRLDKQIFMGNGCCSQAKVGYLFSILAEAIHILGAIQQPSRTDDNEQQWISEQEEIVKDYARQIHVALTGNFPKL